MTWYRYGASAPSDTPLGKEVSKITIHLDPESPPFNLHAGYCPLGMIAEWTDGVGHLSVWEYDTNYLPFRRFRASHRESLLAYAHYCDGTNAVLEWPLR